MEVSHQPFGGSRVDVSLCGRTVLYFGLGDTAYSELVRAGEGCAKR